MSFQVFRLDMNVYGCAFVSFSAVLLYLAITPSTDENRAISTTDTNPHTNKQTKKMISLNGKRILSIWKRLCRRFSFSYHSLCECDHFFAVYYCCWCWRRFTWASLHIVITLAHFWITRWCTPTPCHWLAPRFLFFSYSLVQFSFFSFSFSFSF